LVHFIDISFSTPAQQSLFFGYCRLVHITDIIFSEVFIAKYSTVIDPFKNITILLDRFLDITKNEQR